MMATVVVVAHMAPMPPNTLYAIKQIQIHLGIQIQIRWGAVDPYPVTGKKKSIRRICTTNTILFFRIRNQIQISRSDCISMNNRYVIGIRITFYGIY